MTSRTNDGAMLLRPEGPFGFVHDGCAPCLFNAGAHLRCGIYFFTIAYGGRELIHYVGQTTRSFCDRLGEELKDYNRGRFEIYDGDAFVRGELHEVWSRVCWSAERAAEFRVRLDELRPHLDRQLRALRLWLIPIDTDARTIKLMESAMSRMLHQQSAPIGTFLYKPKPTHRRKNEPPIAFAIENHERFLGMPALLTT